MKCEERKREKVDKDDGYCWFQSDVLFQELNIHK